MKAFLGNRLPRQPWLTTGCCLLGFLLWGCLIPFDPDSVDFEEPNVDPQLIVVSPDPQGTGSFACALEIRLTPLNLELIDPAQTDGTATDGQGHFHIQINDVHIVGDPPLGRPQFQTAIDVPLRSLRLAPGQQTLTITTQQNDDTNYPGIPATRVTWDYPGHPEDGCNPEGANPEGGNPGGGS